MKRMLLLLAVIGAAVASAHVMDDAVLYFRGMGCTRTEDGQFVDGDARDALTLGGGDAALGGGKRYGYPAGVQWRTERVARPYTGRAQDERVLYLAQPVDWTGPDPQTAEVWPGAVNFSNVLKDSGIGCDYTIFARVRFDREEPYAQSVYHFLDVGYANGNSGAMLSMETGSNGTKYIRCYYGATNDVGKAVPSAFSATSSFSPDEWVDVCLAVNDRTFKLYFCRTNSVIGTATHTMAPDRCGGLTLTRHPFVLLGTEDGTATTRSTITNGVSKVHKWGDAICSPRVSYGQLAIWGRTLTEAEVREVMADGLPEMFRVGVANGKSQEFSPTPRTAVADVTDAWTSFPAALASGQSVTFRFQTPNNAVTNLAEVFRWTATADSAAGRIRVDVNGRTVDTVGVVPGGTACAFVPPGVIDRTTGNELTVTRVDGGAGVVTLDAAALGGSWQVGLEDKRNSPFCAEWLNSPNFYVTDTDWSHLRRVISESPGRTNLVFHFDIPGDLLDRHYRFIHEGAFNKWYQSGDVRDHQGYAISFNGRILDEGNVPDAYAVVRYELPQDLLKERDNVLQWINTGSSTASAAPYYDLDFFRVFVKAPNLGTMLLIR